MNSFCNTVFVIVIQIKLVFVVVVFIGVNSVPNSFGIIIAQSWQSRRSIKSIGLNRRPDLWMSTYRRM